MEVGLLVPWRPGDAHREAAWSLLKAHHLAAGRTVIEGGCDGPWRKAVAIADALSRSTADLLVIHDADVLTDGLDEGIAAVHGGAAWAVPHWRVHRLAEGQQPGGVLAQPAYPGYAGGGITVIRRDVYEDCPLDPRFAGWGQEDESLALALECLHGKPWRGSADLWHWWHPPQPRQSRVVGSDESKALHRLYKNSARNRTLMRELIEEAKSWQSTSSSIVPASAPS